MKFLIDIIKKVRGMVFLAGKGSTAYEVQVGKVVFRCVHLSGRYWRFKPWRRFSVKYYPEG